MLVPDRSRIEAFPKVPQLLGVCQTTRFECYRIFWLENTFAFKLGQAHRSMSDIIFTWTGAHAPSARNVTMALHFVLGRGLALYIPASLAITWKPSGNNPAAR